MLLVATKVQKGRKPKDVESFARTAGENEIMSLHLNEGECIWIESPLGLLRVSAIMKDKLQIETFTDHKGIKFERV